MTEETFKEGDKVVAFVDEINEWVKGTFMFYFNKHGAYVHLDKIILIVIPGKLYTSEPVIPIEKIKFQSSNMGN